MYQEEAHPDVESLAEPVGGAQSAVDVTTGLAKTNGGLPTLDVSTMPESTNIEDRRGRNDVQAGNRPTGSGGQLFGDGNEEITQLADYLQTLKETAPTEGQIASTHPTINEPDKEANQTLGNATATKLGLWGAYFGAAAGAPKLTPALDALWGGAWLLAGHSLRADVQRQVKEGKSIDQITFDKGSIGDLGGIISALKDKYVKPSQEAQKFGDDVKRTPEEEQRLRNYFKRGFDNNSQSTVNFEDLDLFDDEQRKWDAQTPEEKAKIRAGAFERQLEENKKRNLEDSRFKMSPTELRKSIQEEQDKAKLREEADKIKKNNKDLLK